MIYFLLFFLGAAIGSFVMVVSDRLRVKSFKNSRSVCMSCNTDLSWYETIPVISFLLQNGKCRSCGSAIGFNLFLAEIVSGLIFVVLPFSLKYYSSDIYIQSMIFILFVFVYILSMFILIYDIKHKIINLESLFFLFILSVCAQFGIQYFDNSPSINYYYLASPLIVSFIFLFSFFISKGKWIGLGDVLLYIVFGLMLPLPIAISGMFLSVWLGAVVHLFLYTFRSHKYKSQTQIPFAPFIVIGFLISFLLNLDLLNISLLF